MARSRSFAFTWNNYPEDCSEKLALLSFKYLVFGREVGESGTAHLQGHVVFKQQRTLSSAIKALPGCHVSIAVDTEASIAYCKKGGDFKEFGKYSSRSSNALSQSQARAARNKILIGTNIKDLLDSGEISLSQASLIHKGQNLYYAQLKPYRHHEPRGVWVYGPPGTGKSYDARAMFPDAFIKQQNKWWDGYIGQKQVILDDLDSEVLGHYIKIWTDEYPVSGEVKNGHVQLVYQVFYITSNYSPEDLFKDPVMAQAVRRRCKVSQKLDHVFNGRSNMEPIHISADFYP